MPSLAERVGRPTASRAVGHANGCNPIWIIVPCHRVIGAGGNLTGYAGVVDKKHWLLVWERCATAVEPGYLFDAAGISPDDYPSHLPSSQPDEASRTR